MTAARGAHLSRSVQYNRGQAPYCLLGRVHIAQAASRRVRVGRDRAVSANHHNVVVEAKRHTRSSQSYSHTQLLFYLSAETNLSLGQLVLATSRKRDRAI